ncbi:MAG: hypothetical protein A2W90_12455 [Bacteroidetes bacterium GWF2_42_66]|nr:MAG: hypothetical protein A2W92_22970 [Bacteroidetes bacterium GWA2_42_15]OFX99997.1 MAG: hypothetical protein A2W89_17440 [Bacteroidetes bacterium GWE2_42_39]OFY40183.1 MAG: hypothetical protein A2W90_12455 [Bacteroidetes bacterium GWF2_42_66]HBL74012.1 hypothetical protein [Prolixibacteraceae bacterium]HCR89568.1 hypothetical protein [Prolixibacteraceae bacterium]
MSLKNKNQIIGYLLTLFILLALLNSAYFFLFVVKLGFCKWLAFNACSLSIVTYLICFICFQITKKDFFLAIALVPLYYYGTMGLFITPWNATNMIAQITHIIITLNVIWILFVLLKGSKYESLGKGLLIGILVFVPVFAVIQSYSQLHMAEFMQMLQKVQ